MQDPLQIRIQQTILTMLLERAHGATICPSEAARQIAPNDWRSLLDATRAAARQLVQEGVIVITQKGKVIDPDRAKGPIRLRLR